jgi:hypothetical protein
MVREICWSLDDGCQFSCGVVEHFTRSSLRDWSDDASIHGNVDIYSFQLAFQTFLDWLKDYTPVVWYIGLSLH